jgi:hypothetical protein
LVWENAAQRSGVLFWLRATFAQFFSSTPLTGIMDYPVAFAAAGTTTAVGGKEERLGALNSEHVISYADRFVVPEPW